MTPQQMVTGVKDLATDWKYDVVSIGYPGLVRHGRITLRPYNLAPGWVGLDFQAAFGCPVKVMNDAAMQALGSYQGGLMLFLGLGTGLGSALITDGAVWPMELAHLAYKKGTLEDYLGVRGLKRLGKKKWKRHVARRGRLTAALHPDDSCLAEARRRTQNAAPGLRQATHAPTRSSAAFACGTARTPRANSWRRRA